MDRLTATAPAHIRRVAELFVAPLDDEAAALRLEFMGRDGDLNGADEAFALLESEMERLKQALTTLVR